VWLGVFFAWKKLEIFSRKKMPRMTILTLLIGRDLSFYRI